MLAVDTSKAISTRAPVPTPVQGGSLQAVIKAIIVAAALTALPAQALQIIEASDGTSVEAILSIKEPTRIRIDGAPITDVFGNIHSSHCNPTAALPATPGMAPTGAVTMPDSRAMSAGIVVASSPCRSASWSTPARRVAVSTIICLPTRT